MAWLLPQPCTWPISRHRIYELQDSVDVEKIAQELPFRDARPSCSHSCNAGSEPATTAEGDAVRPARRLGNVDVLPAVR